MPWQNIRHRKPPAQCPVGNTHTENLGKAFTIGFVISLAKPHKAKQLVIRMNGMR